MKISLKIGLMALALTTAGLGVGTEIGLYGQYQQGKQIKELTTKVDNLTEKVLSYEKAAQIKATLEQGQRLVGKALKTVK